MHTTLHALAHATAAATIALAVGGPAHAQSNLVVSFDAWIADLSVNRDDFGATREVNGSLPFSSTDAPFSAVQGDVLYLTARILDGVVEVPAGDRQSIFLDLLGPASPQFDASSTEVVFEGSFSFYLDDLHVRTAYSGCSNCVFYGFSELSVDAMRFNRIQAEGRFVNLTAPYEITSALLGFNSVTAVPEPATWALWLAGAGLLAAGRRRSAASKRP